MQITLTLTATTDQEARSLGGIVDLVTGNLAGKGALKVEAIEAKAIEGAKKEAKKEKLEKRKAAPIEDDDELDLAGDDDSSSDDDDLDFGDDEEEAEVEEAPAKRKGPGRPPKEEPKAAKVELSEVIAGFKEYAQKHGREKAGKILEKFGVKSVREIAKSDYAAALKQIKK